MSYSSPACYVCGKTTTKSLRTWESKLGCSTCRNYFNSCFDSVYPAINQMNSSTFDLEIINPNGKIILVFWSLLNSKSDCYTLQTCVDFSKLCIFKAHPVSKCNKCQFRKMFFLFGPPCTKNAKINLVNYSKIKGNWKTIRFWIKKKIASNEMIEVGELVIGKRQGFRRVKKVGCKIKNKRKNRAPFGRVIAYGLLRNQLIFED